MTAASSGAVDSAGSGASGILGLFGGTFDPVHRAHLQFAAEACSALHLSQVLWIPAGRPPHRAPPLAAAEHRLAMVRLAIANEPRFVLDDSEVRSTAPSYTVTTLQRLREMHGQRPFVLLLGADAFLGLAAWHRWCELFALTHIAIATRPGYVLDESAMNPALREEYRARKSNDLSCLSKQPSGRIVSFAMTAMDVSATQIRAMRAAGESAQDLLPGAVLDYIAANHLYPAPAPH